MYAKICLKDYHGQKKDVRNKRHETLQIHLILYTYLTNAEFEMDSLCRIRNSLCLYIDRQRARERDTGIESVTHVAMHHPNSREFSQRKMSVTLFTEYLRILGSFILWPNARARVCVCFLSSFFSIYLAECRRLSLLSLLESRRTQRKPTLCMNEITSVEECVYLLFKMIYDVWYGANSVRLVLSICLFHAHTIEEKRKHRKTNICNQFRF